MHHEGFFTSLAHFFEFKCGKKGLIKKCLICFRRKVTCVCMGAVALMFSLFIQRRKKVMAICSATIGYNISIDNIYCMVARNVADLR